MTLELSVDDPAQDEINREIGNRLKAFRVSLGKTQAFFADVLDISPQQYQKYEKGSSKCSIASLYELANHFNVQVTDLLPPQHRFDIGEEKVGAIAGFEEPTEPVALTDETQAMSELLSVFSRVPSISMRRKLLTLLNTMYE